MRQYLIQERPELVDEGWDRIHTGHESSWPLGQWHFNIHPHYVTKFFLYAKEEPGKRKAYFPIRNPIDVCDSWERRYGDAHDKAAFEMIGAITSMVHNWVENTEHIERFKMEELPVLKGFGPNPEGWEKIGPEHQRVTEVRDFIRSEPEVEGFYRSLYTPEELWWL